MTVTIQEPTRFSMLWMRSAMNLISANRSGWMWISTNSSGIPKQDFTRTVLWIRLILIFWKSRWLKNRKREDFSAAWKILSSSISSSHPNKFHWKDISFPYLPIYLIGFYCFELYRLITYMSNRKTVFLFLYNPNSISPDIFLLNKKKQKSQTALLLHLSELPVSFYISLKFFILLESINNI